MANENKEHIYALYGIRNGVKEYFYVGRSEREPSIRFKEHEYSARNTKKQEDVYLHIRQEFMRCDVFLVEHEVLCWCDEFAPQDYEDFYVIKLIREGYELQNMKHGDQKRLAAIADAKQLATDNVEIATVGQLREYRARKAFERSEALRKEVLGTGVAPKPNKALDEWIANQSIRAAEDSRLKAAKARKANINKAAREKEHQDWLATQRHIFEQKNQVVVAQDK